MRESDFISVITAIALQNMFPVNLSFRALFKQIATSCGGFFFRLFRFFLFLVWGFFLTEVYTLKICFIKTVF